MQTETHDASNAILYRYPYNVTSMVKLPAFSVELQAFVDAPYEGSLSKFYHCYRAMSLLWPWVVKDTSWNPWMERAFRAFTNEKYAVRRHGTVSRVVVLSGCAAASKTFCSALYMCLWWLASPENSIAYFTSTSRNMIRRRGWPIVQQYATQGVFNYKTGELAPFGGNMVDSQTMLQAFKGKDKNSISALAVAQGETNNAVARLSGQHDTRMLLVIDEGQATPEAIYATIPNMRKGCKDLTIIILENPSGKLRPSGRASEPAKGWSSVGVESEIWATKGVPEWQLDPGVCIRFDGAKSPNVMLGKDKWPFLYTCADWQSAQLPGRANSLAYWVQDRGLQPPEGVSDTILTEQLVEQSDGYGTFTWGQLKRHIAFLDPAFGGDTCVLQFAEVGDLPDGKEAIQLTEHIVIPISPESKEPIERQIAVHTMDNCRRRGVRPENFGLDATAIGRGVAYAIQEEWSPMIRRVEFGGQCSDRPAAADDNRPCKDVYDRKVTEMWFSVREFLMAGQLKGFYPQAVSEGCSRQYEMKGRKYSVETKEDMKSKLGYSPDHFDAVAGVVEVARQQGVELMSKIDARLNRQWEQEARENAQDLDFVPTDIDEGGWGIESFLDD